MNTKYTFSTAQQVLIERTRLLEKFENAIYHKLTLVIAPPGYGKTTIASQFIQGTTLRTAWLTLDKSNHDLANLFEDMLTALLALLPDILSNLPVSRTTPNELATILADYLETHLREDCFIVLDNIHELAEPSDAKVWLDGFISALPAKCHLILIGQKSPLLHIRHLVAQQKLLSIGAEELQFNIRETQQLALRVGSVLSSHQIARICSRLSGWPAGIFLALQPPAVEIENTLFEGNAQPETLFDSLADLMFNAQSFGLQAFLLGSSTLTRITPALCQIVLHLSNSSEFLAEALQHGLFIYEAQGGLVYHTLFRDFLQRKLRTQNPSQYIQYHKRAGEWFESENKLDEAFDHYVAADQWELASNIAEQASHVYLGQGKSETLLRWEIVLNSAKVYTPRFRHICAMIHKDRYEYDLAMTNAAAAEIGFQHNNDTMGAVQIALFRAALDNQLGNFKDAFNNAEPLSQDMTIPFNLRGYALAIMGTAALYLERLDDARLLLESALPLWRDTGDQFAVAQLLMTNELMYLRLGLLSDALRCGQEVMSIRRSFGETLGIGMALNNLGAEYLLLGNYDQAHKTLQEGLDIVKRAAENRVESYLLWTMGDLRRDLGAFDEAELLYQRSLQIMSHAEPLLQTSVLLNLATLRRWEGDLDEARKFATQAQMIAQDHFLKWEYRLAELAVAAIRIQDGEIDNIHDELEDIINDWIQHPSNQFAYALGLGAYAALRRGDDITAHHYFRLAVVHANHVGNLHSLIAEIIHTPLLKSFIESQAKRYTMLYEAVKVLDEAQFQTKGLKEPIPSSQTNWTYSLRVSVLGHELIERDGKTISLSQWQASSARELFFYLLFKRESTKDEISLTLWPDSSIQQARQKFHITLHRSRDAIGTNAIIYENELYSINPQIDLWCDVFEFEAAIKQAELSSPLLPHTELLWQRATDLYRGDFLPAFDMDWVENYREKLNQMYIDALVSLAKCVRLRGDIRRSVTLLKRALEVDSFREDIHCLLLQDYYALGKRALIARHMSRLMQLFREELGITPSSETLELSKMLLS